MNDWFAIAILFLFFTLSVLVARCDTTPEEPGQGCTITIHCETPE